MKKILCVIISLIMLIGGVPMSILAEETASGNIAELAKLTDEDTSSQTTVEHILGFDEGFKDETTYFGKACPQNITFDWGENPVSFNTITMLANYPIDQGVHSISLDVSYDGETYVREVTNRKFAWTKKEGLEQQSISFKRLDNVKKMKMRIETAGLTWGHYVFKVKITDTPVEKIFENNYNSLTYATIYNNDFYYDEINRPHVKAGSNAPLNLPKNTEDGVEIDWTCEPDILNVVTGELKIPLEKNTDVKLTATLKYGKDTKTKDFYHTFRVPINYALTSKVTASSEVPGYEMKNAVEAMSYKHWASKERTPWLKLEWEKPIQVKHIMLADIPNTEWENVLDSHLEFSDGSTISVGALPPDGIGKDIFLDTPKNITWVKYVVTKEGGNGGYGGLLNISVLDRSPYSEEPIIVHPLPKTVDGVKEPVISLDGKWKFTKNVPNNFWETNVDTSSWADINVPGELEFEGQHVIPPLDNPNWGAAPEYLPGEDIEYPYKTTITVPEDYKDKRVFLRFDSTFTYARIWVDGKYVGDHEGGYSTWDIDITDFVTPGKTAQVTVGLTARKEFIEFRHARGILGGVELFTLPKAELTRFIYDPVFDKDLNDATLRVTQRVDFNDGETNAQVKLKLTDPNGKEVAISPSVIELTNKANEKTVSIPIKSPMKWDSEHPNLYVLDCEVISNDKVVQTLTKKVGFRDVRVNGSKIFVNGKETKFRGGNLLRGTASTGESVASDEFVKDMIKAMKDANYNYVRAAHYPFTTEVLEYCDEIGMYVEQEVSNTFVAGGVNAPGSQYDPAFTSRYMNPLYEMFEKDRSHASITVWSVGNESFWGTHLQKSQDYLHQEDLQHRPVIFSWADSRSDIFGLHYNYPMENNNKPVIFQEIHWALNYADDSDPTSGINYADVLGHDWEIIYNSDCNSGMVPWTFLDIKPEGQNRVGSVGGIYDSWGRPKPEYYPMKKMYSPIVIDEQTPLTSKKGSITMPIENRYNFASLNEVKFVYDVAGEKGEFMGPNVNARAKGTLSLPNRDWKLGDVIKLEAYEKDYTNDGWRLIDQWELNVGYLSLEYPQSPQKAPDLSETDKTITVSGTDFFVEFSKETGLITNGTYKDKKVINSGPYLNFGAGRVSNWELQSINASKMDKDVMIYIQGISASDFDTVFRIKIDGAGKITTEYTIYNEDNKKTHELELGVSFDLTSDINDLSWLRADEKISSYPDDHILRNEGLAEKYPTYQRKWGEEPKLDWNEDSSYRVVEFEHAGTPFAKNLKATNDFRSSKPNTYYAAATLKDSEVGVRVEGDGNIGVRCEVQEDNNVRLVVNNKWSYVGYTYRDKFYLPDGYTNSVTIRLSDKDDYKKVYTKDNLTKDDGINNIERDAKVTASSVLGFGNDAFYAIDGNDVGGTEWVSKGELTPWLRLDWDEEVEVDVVRIWDRNNGEKILDGYIEFSDGTRVQVGDIETDSKRYKEIKLPKTIKTNSAKFVVTKSAGVNIGLASIEFITVPKDNIISK